MSGVARVPAPLAALSVTVRIKAVLGVVTETSGYLNPESNINNTLLSALYMLGEAVAIPDMIFR